MARRYFPSIPRLFPEIDSPTTLFSAWKEKENKIQKGLLSKA